MQRCCLYPVLLVFMFAVLNGVGRDVSNAAGVLLFPRLLYHSLYRRHLRFVAGLSIFNSNA